MNTQAAAEARGPSKEAPTHLQSLPDDLLLRCLVHLSQQER